MTVKLLPKNELASIKAKQSSREIQEGVKIATRVDGLRELWSKTEQDFETYKTATLGAIQKEIDELIGKKDGLSDDLRKMQSKYDSLMPDLSIKRTELAQFEKKLFSWEKKLDKREETAGLMEIDVKEALDSAEEARVHAEDNERIARNSLATANNKKQEAESTLSTARKVQEKAYQDKKEFETAFELRENSIKSKEQELSKKELSLMNFEKELNDEKVRVNDTRAMLERSIARLREGRHA